MKNNIVLIKFPFSDLTNFKVRPALKIVELTGFNNIYIQITSKKSNLKNYEVEVDNKILNVKSYIRIDRIITLDKRLELKEIGKLKKNEIEELNDKFKNLFKIV